MARLAHFSWPRSLLGESRRPGCAVSWRNRGAPFLAGLFSAFDRL